MYRYYQSLLFELLELFPCVALLGVRQCGKTTLLQQLPAEWQHFDMEQGSDYELISADPDLFLRLHPQQIAIDEAQLLPALFPALRVAIDANRNQCGRVMITGSSSPELVRSISESLAGRIAIIELAPFSLGEAQAAPIASIYQLLAAAAPIDELQKLPQQHSLDAVHDYWFRGGYPEPWIKDSPRFSQLWFQNYLNTYIDRDILRLFPNINQQKYRMFIKLLSHLSGTIINYSEIARTLAISAPTAREYLQIAHGTMLWRDIPAFSASGSKRTIKHPKGFFRDSGLLHHILHINNQQDLLTHPALGSSWESMIIEQLLRGLNALGLALEYSHYRTGAGAEIDLIIEGAWGLIPIEIKYSQHVNQRNLRALNDFISEYKCQYGIVINNDTQIRRYNEQIIGIPSSCL